MRNQPIAIVSKQRNLIVDYLLTSTETTLSKINSLLDNLPKERKPENLYMLQLDHPICKSKKMQEGDALTL